MADVQVTSAELRDGVLTVSGSGFTKTTTTVRIDGVDTAFVTDEAFDGTEFIVNDVPPGASQVEVSKGEITSSVAITTDPAAAQATPAEGDQTAAGAPSTTEPATEPQQPATESSGPYDPGGDVHAEGYKTEVPNTTPGDLVEDDLKTTADVSQADLATGASAGAAAGAPPPEPNREAYAEGEHLGEDFRFRVENTAAEDITKTVDVRQPYPTGNPPSPRDSYYMIHGHYPVDKPEDNATPQAKPEGAV